ncbi:hypothetical protein QP162_05645 [Sphingomonas aurantiaca]|uniref:hypothetical protein n=1 Tax=Sphingomonas aurantiaca TaxID=185949 RepID=UPI002FE0A138
MTVPVWAADARTIAIDASARTTPRDRMAELSVGADFPGTLQREDSLAQLATVQKELRFRYIRFHNVFADQPGRVPRGERRARL